MCENKEMEKEFMVRNFERLIDMQFSYQSRGQFNHALNFRTSKKKSNMLDEELEKLKEVGIRLSKNDLINLCIDLVFGYKQNELHHFYRTKQGQVFSSYINENKSNIESLVKDHLFQKKYDIINKPIKSKKDKKNQVQQFRRLEQKEKDLFD